MRDWIKMIVCFLAVGGFIKIFPLLSNRMDTYRMIMKNSEQLGIDNASLFYSEEPLTSKAEQELFKRLNSEFE